MTAQILRTEAPPRTPSVHCDFCANRIPAASFEYVYWSGAGQLLSASCGACHQRMVLPYKLWRRRSGMSVPSVD